MLQSAFELYGADFMIGENYQPYLLEVNASPGMAPACLKKAKLCADVVDDTIKGNYNTPTLRLGL
jgi:tubulin monoglycylase TTLL3/8